MLETNFRPGRMSTLAWVAAVTLTSALSTATLPARAEGPVNSQAPAAQRETALGLQDVLEDVGKRVGPTVVHIEAEITTASRPGGGGGGDNGPQIFPFGPGIPGFPGPNTAPRRQGASGSGVIVSPDGIIVTNRHVIEGARRVTVTLTDHRIFIGTPYTDPNVDIAVVKINTTNLPYAQLGPSADLKIGQWAIAIGYPFDVGETMSLGIISSLGRSQVIENHYYPDLIQTDASINPGNSGGPLLDIHGNIIGINTAIAGEAAQSAGIGFAIPADTVKLVYTQLSTGTHKITNYPAGWRRGMLGVKGPRTVTPDLSKVLGVDQGVLVSEVMAGSPAAQAGVEAGDVIVTVNGVPVRDDQELIDVVSALGPQKKAVLDIVRNKQHITKTLITEAFGDTVAGAPAQPERRMGLSVTTLTPDMRADLKLPSTVHDGVVVTAVQPGSPADQAGFQQGDVIVSVNETPVHSTDDYETALGKTKAGDSAGVKVQRGATTAFLILQIPDDNP